MQFDACRKIKGFYVKRYSLSFRLLRIQDSGKRDLNSLSLNYTTMIIELLGYNQALSRSVHGNEVRP